MRSRLTCSNPAALAHSTACGTRSGSWVRSSTESTWVTCDCMPKEIRVNPPSRSRASPSGVTESGLASVVTSTSGLSPSSSRAAASTLARSSGGSSVGVPPPRKTVSTRTSRSPSTPRIRRTSATAASPYVAREAPGIVAGPSSSAV